MTPDRGPMATPNPDELTKPIKSVSIRYCDICYESKAISGIYHHAALSTQHLQMDKQPKRSDLMGDKGGKKDKEKGQKQTAEKQKQKTKKQADKQPAKKA